MISQISTGLPAELEQVELNILVVDTDAAAAAAKQRITDGEDFGEVAKEVSLHSSATNGGAIGWTPKELLSDDLAEPVFALEADSVSDVIETENGFYVVKINGKEMRAVDDGMKSNLARTEFGKRLEAASEEYELQNLVTVEQAQRIANQIQVPGG
jgi:parvulin-like peptidyl-prolyl isomerase